MNEDVNVKQQNSRTLNFFPYSYQKMNLKILKKKRHVIFITVCVGACFLLHQIYYYSSIETRNGNMVVPVFDQESIKEAIHVRSEADKYINKHGVVKGVLEKIMVKYRPDSSGKFQCLNSNQRIPFEAVNDDYCDCDDGTDEPSTSACVDGLFYCDIQYASKPVSLVKVPSSRVNDGICDCCDGSDEWLLDPDKKLLSQSYDKFYRYKVPLCPNVCAA